MANYKWGTLHRMSAPGVLVLGSGGQDAARSIIVELRPNAATYSMTPRGRVSGIEGAPDPDATDTPLDATDLTTGNPTGGAAITGTGSSTKAMYRIYGDAQSVALDFSTLSAGTVDVAVGTVAG